MEAKQERLLRILKVVDSFSELYLKTVTKWMAKEKCDVSMFHFVLGKSPYYFPPEIEYTKDGKKERILNFKLPYKREESHCTDSDASDINQFLEDRPECYGLIMERFEEHLKDFHKIKGVPVLKPEKQEENLILVMQGFYKEMDYHKTSLSIYDFIREKGDEEEDKICDYLKEGTIVMQSHAKMKDVINHENGTIGHMCLRTDGIWMWPEELAYYVKTYHLKLDDKFIDTMRANDWHIERKLLLDYSKLEFLDHNRLGINE